MKTWILVSGLLLLGNLSAQTKMIALKSHSGELTALKNEKDGNFGIAPTRLDSVVKIGANCVVEINNYGFRDTVYEHPYFLNPDMSLQELQQRFPRIHFVGFDKKWPTSIQKKSKRTKSVLYFLGLTLACWGISQRTRRTENV